MYVCMYVCVCVYIYIYTDSHRGSGMIQRVLKTMRASFLAQVLIDKLYNSQALRKF